jgi:hypothetical protein
VTDPRDDAYLAEAWQNEVGTTKPPPARTTTITVPRRAVSDLDCAWTTCAAVLAFACSWRRWVRGNRRDRDCQYRR